MNSLLLLVPVSLLLLAFAIWVFRWAVRKGQFENLDAAAIDILRDDRADAPPPAPYGDAGEPPAPRGPDHAD